VEAAVAYNLLWTVRGIPCLYYGEEIEFQKGAPQDISFVTPSTRPVGPTSVTPVRRAHRGDQAPPLFAHLQRLNLHSSRRRCVEKAPMSQVNEWGAGMSFVRDYRDGESYAVVGLAAGTEQSIGLSGLRNGTYRDAVTGNEAQVSDGTLSFQVKATPLESTSRTAGKIGLDGPYLR